MRVDAQPGLVTLAGKFWSANSRRIGETAVIETSEGTRRLTSVFITHGIVVLFFEIDGVCSVGPGECLTIGQVPDCPLAIGAGLQDAHVCPVCGVGMPSTWSDDHQQHAFKNGWLHPQ